MSIDYSKDITTPIGILRGRDAIYLDSSEYRRPNLSVTGTLNGPLATAATAEWYKYVIEFSGVLWSCVTELETWYDIHRDEETSSSFFETVGHGWKKQFGQALSDNYRKFTLFTYDDVYEVICKQYEIQVNEVQVAECEPENE